MRKVYQRFFDSPTVEYIEANPSEDNKVEIFGCPGDWTCDDIIDKMLSNGKYNNIIQVKVGYDAMFDAAINMVNNDEPIVIYTWTPASYITKLIPGENVYWLGMDYLLKDDEPKFNMENGIIRGSKETCPSIKNNECKVGWDSTDVRIVARKDMLDEFPDLRVLLNKIQLPYLDISRLQVEQSDGDGSQEHVIELANKWIKDNRELVDNWLENARNTV